MIKLTKIESDVDGVLADMDGSYGLYLTDLIPDFSEETHILNWDVPEIQRDCPEAYERIKALHISPEFFESLPRYPGIEEALKKLQCLIQALGTKMLIHTHVFTEDCGIKRREWLEKLREDTNVDFEVDISSGDTKNMHTDSTILIEDNVNNCVKSNAAIKILVRRGHNRSYTEKDLGNYIYAFVVDSFPSAVDVIEQLLLDEKVG